MSLVRIDDIQLYTNFNWDNGVVEKPGFECMTAYNFLNENGVVYEHMNYGGDSDFPGSLPALSTWTFAGDRQITFETYPFVIYTEVHDDLSPSQYPKVLLYGNDEIINSNIAELYQLGR